jgi:hypothetical protein
MKKGAFTELLGVSFFSWGMFSCVQKLEKKGDANKQNVDRKHQNAKNTEFHS